MILGTEVGTGFRKLQSITELVRLFYKWVFPGLPEGLHQQYQDLPVEVSIHSLLEVKDG